eukprot:g35597.t1
MTRLHEEEKQKHVREQFQKMHEELAKVKKAHAQTFQELTMRLQKEEKEKHDLQQQLQKKHKELTKVKEEHAQTCKRLQEQETAVRVKRERLSHADAQQREQAIAYKQPLQKTQGEIKAAEGQVEELRNKLTCCVCFEFEISRVLLPCGHCFCDSDEHPWELAPTIPALSSDSWFFTMALSSQILVGQDLTELSFSTLM